jgi:hypothetical protein
MRGTRQLEEVGDEVDGRRRVGEIAHDLGDARLGAQRQRDVDDVDQTGPAGHDEIDELAEEVAVRRRQIDAAIGAPIVVDAEDADAHPGPLFDLLAQVAGLRRRADDGDLLRVPAARAQRAQDRPHEQTPSAQHERREREPPERDDARVRIRRLRREGDEHENSHRHRPGEEHRPDLDAEPLDAPRAVEATDLRGDAEGEDGDERHRARLRRPRLAVDPVEERVDGGHEQDVDEPLDCVDRVLVVADQTWTTRLQRRPPSRTIERSTSDFIGFFSVILEKI